MATSASQALPDRWRALRRFVRQRVDRESELGLRLTLDFILFGFAVWASAGLIEEVLDNESLVRWDVRVNLWMRTHVTTTGLRVFEVITYIGAPGMWVVTTLVAAWLMWRRERFLFWAWMAGNVGGELLQGLLKSIVHRDRPEYAALYYDGQSYSFPSGHAMSATICWLLFVVCVGRSRGWHGARRVRFHVAAATLIVAIGFSRIYLGVHYPSDVIAGASFGMGWVLLWWERVNHQKLSVDPGLA